MSLLCVTFAVCFLFFWEFCKLGQMWRRGTLLHTSLQLPPAISNVGTPTNSTVPKIHLARLADRFSAPSQGQPHLIVQSPVLTHFTECCSSQLPRPEHSGIPATHSDMCILRIRRNHLTEDALDEIARQHRKDLFKPLRVHFIGEEGIDAGGVKKEFFQILVENLLSVDYGMLAFQSESRTYW